MKYTEEKKERRKKETNSADVERNTRTKKTKDGEVKKRKKEANKGTNNAYIENKSRMKERKKKWGDIKTILP